MTQTFAGFASLLIPVHAYSAPATRFSSTLLTMPVLLLCGCGGITVWLLYLSALRDIALMRYFGNPKSGILRVTITITARISTGIGESGDIVAWSLNTNQSEIATMSGRDVWRGSAYSLYVGVRPVISSFRHNDNFQVDCPETASFDTDCKKTLNYPCTLLKYA